MADQMNAFEEDNASQKKLKKPELRKSYAVRVAEAAIFFFVAYGSVSMLAIPLFRIKTEPLMIPFLILPFAVLYAADFFFSDPISSILALMPLSAALGAASFFVMRNEAVVIYVIGFYLMVVSHRVIARMIFDFSRLAGYSAALMLSYIILCSFDGVASGTVMYGFFATVIAGAVIASVSSFERAVADESSSSGDMRKTAGIRVRLAVCTGAVVVCAAVITFTAGRGLSVYDKPVSGFIVSSLPGINITGEDTGQIEDTFKKMNKGRGDMFPESKNKSYTAVIVFLILGFITLTASVAGLFLFALLLINMWRFLHGRDRARDETVLTQSIFSAEEIRERVKSRFGSRDRKGRESGRGVKQRIRTLYRGIVMRMISGGNAAVNMTSTPREIAKVICSDGSLSHVEADVVTDVYERARYASADSPDEDLKKIKVIHDRMMKRRNP